jgi:hypothetical protein
VKVIYRELFRSKSDEQLFDKEVRMLRLLHHPHVIQYVIPIVVFVDFNHIHGLLGFTRCRSLCDRPRSGSWACASSRRSGNDASSPS